MLPFFNKMSNCFRSFAYAAPFLWNHLEIYIFYLYIYIYVFMYSYIYLYVFYMYFKCILNAY